MVTSARLGFFVDGYNVYCNSERREPMEIEIKEITRDNFQTEVIEAGGPVLLDFYADWCGPCKRQLPVLLEAAKEACDVKFCKVNIDHNQELCEKFDHRHPAGRIWMLGPGQACALWDRQKGFLKRPDRQRRKRCGPR